ncbi:hypothetical protein [Chitinophaga sp.]
MQDKTMETFQTSKVSSNYFLYVATSNHEQKAEGKKQKAIEANDIGGY